MLKKAILMAILSISVLGLGGCNDCTEMTSAGTIEDHWNIFVQEDNAYSSDLGPMIKRWWREEKARWPKFRKTCVDAETCYEQSVEKESKTTN